MEERGVEYGKVGGRKSEWKSGGSTYGPRKIEEVYVEEWNSLGWKK